MPDIYDVAAEQKRAISDYNSNAIDDLIKTYQNQRGKLIEQYNDLADYVRANEITSRNKIYQLARYQNLIKQIDTELNDFALYSTNVTIKQKQQAQTIATSDAEELINRFDSFVKINKNAVDSSIALTAPKSPLLDLFSTLNSETVETSRQIIIAGLVQGKAPKITAQALTESLEIPLHRAKTIARTETLRSYRTGSIEAFKASETIKQMQWLCTLSSRTCFACLFYDKQLFDLDFKPTNHVNCRCTYIPVVRDMPDRTSGLEYFDNLSKSEKQNILGDQLGELYHKGEIDSKHLITIHDSPRYGKSYNQASLKQALINQN